MPVARHALHVEADVCQPASHEAGAGEGAQGCPWRRQSGQFGKQRRLPHLRVLRWSESIEEPGVDLRIQARQAFEHVADQQSQHHAPAGEDETLIAWMQRDVLLQQLFCLHLQFRPQCQRALQVGTGQGVLFDADKVQAGLRIGGAFEQVPGTEEVQPRAKAGFADYQMLGAM